MTDVATQVVELGALERLRTGGVRGRRLLTIVGVAVGIVAVGAGLLLNLAVFAGEIRGGTDAVPSATTEFGRMDVSDVAALSMDMASMTPMDHEGLMGDGEVQLVVNLVNSTDHVARVSAGSLRLRTAGETLSPSNTGNLPDIALRPGASVQVRPHFPRPAADRAALVLVEPGAEPAATPSFALPTADADHDSQVPAQPQGRDEHKHKDGQSHDH